MKTNIMLASLVISTAASAATENQASVFHIQSHTAEFEYFSMQEDGSLRKAGNWTDSVEIDDERIVRTVTRKPLGGDPDLVRTVAADSGTLAPIHLTQRFGPGLAGLYHARLQGEQFTQVLIPDDKTPARIMSAHLPPGIVEVNLQGIFAAALPLDSERQISVEGYRSGAEPSSETQVFQVLGRERITIDDRELSAWKVYQPQTNWTYWVRKAPPYLLRVSHPSPDGGTLVSVLVHYEL